MANTTYAFTKATAITDYMPAFRTNAEKQSWDWGQLVTKKKTSRATEQVFSYTGLPVPRQTGELQDIYYADMAELDATTYTVSKYTLATIFSHELLKDNIHLPDLMKEAGAAMGESHSFIRDVAAAQTYNRAFNSSYPLYDGVELCGEHTMNDGTTFDNDLTAASITFDNVWLAVNHFETTLVNHNGLFLRDTPKFLIYHPSKEKEVRAILESQLEPDTADNNKNTLKSYSLKAVPCRHLTTSNNWFIAGSRWPSSVLWFDREKVSVAMEDDFDRMGTKIRSYQRFTLGPKEFVYIVGNPGA